MKKTLFATKLMQFHIVLYILKRTVNLKNLNLKRIEHCNIKSSGRPEVAD